MQETSNGHEVSKLTAVYKLIEIKSDSALLACIERIKEIPAKYKNKDVHCEEEPCNCL